MADSPPPSLDVQHWRPRVHAALRAWHNLKNAPATSLLHELTLTQEHAAATPAGAEAAAQRHHTNAVLEGALTELAQADAEGAQILRAHFVDREKMALIANRLNRGEDAVNHLQRAAIARLTTILLAQEQTARATRAQRLATALPPATYQELFGVSQVQDQLLAELLPAQAPWVLMITGIGGIGKTALADAAVRACLPQQRFDRVVWVRLKPQSALQTSSEQVLQDLMEAVAGQLWPTTAMPPSQQRQAAQHALKARPHLVVVDNLELAAETDYVLQHVEQLANPSKFLLTTRRRPRGHATTFTIPLTELPWEAAQTLLRHQARLSNQPDVAQATATQLEPIYRVVGGNPLALKLVVQLVAFEPLPQILGDLQRNRPGETLNLYRHIYRKTWQALTAPAQALLQAMPLVAEIGGTREHLAEISALPEAPFQAALQELIGWSLLEVRGTAWERRYGIHRLTETFVRLEIIHWPDEADDPDAELLTQ